MIDTSVSTFRREKIKSLYSCLGNALTKLLILHAKLPTKKNKVQVLTKASSNPKRVFYQQTLED